MIKDITIGQYIPGNSPLHRADPRVKIIMTIVYMVLVFLVTSFYGFAMVSLFTLLVIAISNIPFKFTFKGLKPVIFIVVFTAIINILTIRGTIIFEYKFIHISQEGIITAAKMAIRLILLVMGASLLTLTTTPIALTDGIESLLKPLRKIGVPSHEIAMMMSIALRFIPTLLDETDKIIKAQAARGADFDTGGIMQKAKSFIPVLVPLFISAFRRAEELATAMEARCYRGSEGRTIMKQLKLGMTDLYIVIIMALFTAALIYLQWFI